MSYETRQAILHSIRISPDWNVNVGFITSLVVLKAIRITPDWNVNTLILPA